MLILSIPGKIYGISADFEDAKIRTLFMVMLFEFIELLQVIWLPRS